MKESRQKKITVIVKNKQLDALEDLLYCELTDEQKEKSIKNAKKLWTLLVKAYDKKKKAIPHTKSGTFARHTKPTHKS